MTAALIISTGKTDHKIKFSPERQIGGMTAVERIILLFKMIDIDRIVVVGDEKKIPQKLVPFLQVDFLTTPSDKEMFDSIKHGLKYLKNKYDEIFICNVDTPMFSKTTLDLLLRTTADVCIPSYKGIKGHPILIRSSIFDDVLSYNGKGGLRTLFHKFPLNIKIIETNDKGILTERQSGMPYESLLTNNDISKIRASFKININKEKKFYGPGAHQLLQLTEELGSVAKACQHMGMSYSKGRKVISIMEEQMGVQILETQQGGRSGGSSKLTSDAKKIMYKYNSFYKDADSVLQKIFKKHFSDII